MGILFRDGFESGWIPWGAPSKSPTTCTIEIVTGDVPSGSIGSSAAHFKTVGTQQIEYAQVQHTLSPTVNEVYARCYVKILNHTMTDNDRFYIHFLINGANPPLAAAGCVMTGGVLHWNLLSRNGTTTVTNESIDIPMANQWYLVALYWKYGVTDGVTRLSVDGSVVCELTGIDTTAYGSCQVWKTGLPTVANASASVFHWIETLIDDASIEDVPPANPCVLTLTQTTGGTIDTVPTGKHGVGNPYNYGDTAEIVATPNLGAALSDWIITPTPTTATRSGNSFFLTMDNDYTVEAIFISAPPPFPVWLVVLAALGGFAVVAFASRK